MRKRRWHIYFAPVAHADYGVWMLDQITTIGDIEPFTLHLWEGRTWAEAVSTLKRWALGANIW